MSLSFPRVILAASATGALAWVAAYPLDTIKSRAQATAPGMMPLTLRAAMAEAVTHGGLYRGCEGSTLRAVLVTGSRLGAYEAALAAWGPAGAGPRRASA